LTVPLDTMSLGFASPVFETLAIARMCVARSAPLAAST
jgi:hypothetical protein